METIVSKISSSRRRPRISWLWLNQASLMRIPSTRRRQISRSSSPPPPPPRTDRFVSEMICLLPESKLRGRLPLRCQDIRTFPEQARVFSSANLRPEVVFYSDQSSKCEQFGSAPRFYTNQLEASLNGQSRPGGDRCAISGLCTGQD